MGGTRFIIGFEIVKCREKFDFVVDAVCGDGVGKRGGGMDVEIGGLRHHAPEQGYVEPVNGGIEMGFMSLSQLRGQYGLSRFFDGGGLRFKGLCRGEFGDGFRLIF